MFFISLLLFGLSNGVKLPDGMILCHRSDPEFSDCVGKGITQGLQLLANGYKPMRVPVLEPFLVDKMEINEAPTRAVAVTQKFTNLFIHGMTKSTIFNMRIELDNGCGWTMDVDSPQINLIGDLQLQGNILTFTLNSQGRCNITLTDLRHHHTMQCEKFYKNEKAYVRFTKYSVELYPEHIHYDLTNLFPANKQIEKVMKKTINDNSLLVFNDVKRGFEESFSIFHQEIANLVFNQVPMDEVFLP